MTRAAGGPTLLVVGDDAQIGRIAKQLSKQLATVAFAPGLGEAKGSPHLQLLGGRVVAVTGALGSFRAQAATPGGQSSDIGVFGSQPDGTFHLVLDLGSRPLVDPSNAPKGYFAARTQTELDVAMECLPLLRGTHADAHAGHVRVRLDVCTLCGACANACPTGALRRSSGRATRLLLREPACVQCGQCVTACPEHALSLQQRASALPLRPEMVLAQSSGMRCRECGEAFGSQAAHARFKGSAPLPPAAQRALELCPHCRPRALFAFS